MNQHFVTAFKLGQSIIQHSDVTFINPLQTLTELVDTIQHTITIIPIGRVLNGIRIVDVYCGFKLFTMRFSLKSGNSQFPLNITDFADTTTIVNNTSEFELFLVSLMLNVTFIKNL